MKGTVLRKDFSQSLSTASRFISSRAQLPILSNVVLKADKARLHLYATNLEISIAISQGAKIEEEGEIAVPARTINDLVHNLSGESISFETQQETLHLQTESFSGTVAAMNPSDFPVIPVSIEKETLALPANDLLEAISQVLYSVSADETRPVLSGVLFKFEGDTLMLVASDGYRLAQRVMKLPSPVKESSIIIPKGILSELGRIVSQDSIQVEIREKESQILFALNDTVLSSRTIEGEYPPFEAVIQKQTSVEVQVDKHDLVNAVKISAVYAREGGNSVKFTVKDGALVLSAQSSTVGSQETSVDASVNGGDAEVALNYKFVEDLLNVIKEPTVNIKLQDSSSPVKFRGEGNEELLHLVMPLRS